MKCLIIHRSATMRRIFGNALREIGCAEIAETEEWDDAVGQLLENATDLVIAEWSTTGADGLELIKQIRTREATSKVPILMVSARNSKEDVMLAVEAGVSAYLLKPFTAEALKHKLDQLLGSKKAETTEAAASEQPAPAQEALTAKATEGSE